MPNELVLIVDDEPDIVSTLEYNLEREGYRTRAATNGAEAVDLAGREPIPDLVLLDIMLPDMSGTEVCRQLREREATRSVPVIMLTARGEEIDRVVGFEVGADDYVTKPYSVRELLLRIRAILRRTRDRGAKQERLTHGRLQVDLSSHRVWVDAQEVTLTSLEFKLLRNLLERRGRVQTRDMLLQEVWGIDADVTTRTVDTHIMRLRQKLESAGDYIETLRGAGYRLREDGEGVA